MFCSVWFEELVGSLWIGGLGGGLESVNLKFASYRWSSSTVIRTVAVVLRKYLGIQ